MRSVYCRRPIDEKTPAAKTIANAIKYSKGDEVVAIVTPQTGSLAQGYADGATA